MSDMKALSELTLDRVEFYVRDTGTSDTQFTDGYGFSVHAESRHHEHPDAVRSLALGKNRTRLVLTMAHDADHPAAAHVGRHDDGVANIVLRTPDAAAASTSCGRLRLAPKAS